MGFDQTGHTLRMGDKYPYDAPDSWWKSPSPLPPTHKDWAHRAARAVLADLQDRGGIKHGFAKIPEDVRADIVSDLSDIIRRACEEGD